MKVERVRQEMSLMLWSCLVNTADFCECKVVQLGNNFNVLRVREQHTTFERKGATSVFPVLPGNAQALLR